MNTKTDYNLKRDSAQLPNAAQTQKQQQQEMDTSRLQFDRDHGGVNVIVDNQAGRDELRYRPPSEKEVPTKLDNTPWITEYETDWRKLQGGNE